MRALHLLKTAVGATWAARQARVLVEHGVEVHVALPDGPMVERFIAAGAHPHIADIAMPTTAVTRVPSVLRRLRDLVDAVAPDIIHSHFVATTLAMRIGLGRHHPIPRVYQVPGPLHLLNPVLKRVEIATAGPLDHWIGSCEWTCAEYRRSGIAPGRIHHSVYGVDLETFVAGDPTRLRAELGLAATTQIVGMVAYVYAPKRLLGQRRGLKGHEDLVDALVLMRRTGRDVVGVFVGGAWDGATAYEHEVHAYARERLGPAAIFLGTRTDVPDLYAGMDVVAIPSHTENLGGASESLLIACPTVATNVGGLPDLVHDGETGWLVPPHDPRALATALGDALDHPDEAARRGRAGQVLARHLMDVRRTGAEIVEIYRDVLGG